MNRQFGNYILHERVGIGGMGEVFRATKLGPDGFEVEVALKVILPHLAREDTFKKRFSREARLAASLKHPNIVQVNGFDIIDGTPFIEMEYIPGVDLRGILRLPSPNEQISLNESIAILYAVARGLNHAHCHGGGEKGEGGIIHCDLNPHNILISNLGEVKVVDFGIARAMLGDIAASATIRGKLAYMSPEQMAGKELSRHTDLFSFGIIAYQLFSGNHPFDRGSEAATISAIGKAEHHSLHDAAPNLPPALHKLVDQLLSLDPAERPESTASVLETLEPLVLPSAVTTLASRVRSVTPEINGAAGSVPDGSPTEPTIPRSRRSHLWPYLAMITAGAALVAGIFLLPTGMESKRAPALQIKAVAPEPALKPSPQPETVPLEHTITLGSEPSGATILADGIRVGTTPVKIRNDLDDQPVNMEARLYGFREEHFRIPPGTEERYVVTLVPLATGTVRISANPWARVTFRGEEQGYTPVTIPNVPVGQHTFTLSYDPLGVERKIGKEVREGMNTVSVDMSESP